MKLHKKSAMFNYGSVLIRLGNVITICLNPICHSLPIKYKFKPMNAVRHKQNRSRRFKPADQMASPV